MTSDFRESELSAKTRFFFGGLGALMPVIVAMISLDLTTVFSDEKIFTAANIIGISLRYFALFGLGGLVAYLHTDESKPFKLFELGIAAPALVASIVAGNAIKSQPTPIAQKIGDAVDKFGTIFISSALASDIDIRPKAQSQGSIIFSEIISGLTGSVYREPAKAMLPTPAVPQNTSWKWIVSSSGALPENSFQAGIDKSTRIGEVLYVCRVQFKGGVHPGRISKGSPGCTFGYAGQEIVQETYEVLVGSGMKWVTPQNNKMPPDAIVGGQESGKSDPLIICRAKLHGSNVPGKTSPSKGCNVAFAGHESREDSFEVLLP